MADRVPPHSLNDEEALLGAMMLSREAIRAATACQISAADFYRPAHVVVFDAAMALYERSAPVDPITVAAELGNRLASVGDLKQLLALQAATPASANAEQYARVVRDCARRRSLIVWANRLAAVSYEGADTDAVVAELTQVGAPARAPFEWDDLTGILDGSVVPPSPGLLYREDNLGLFYPAALNLVFGADGTGKTWVSLVAAAAVMRAGGLVLHLDYDDTAATNVGRLQSLSCTPEEIRDRYRHRSDPARLTIEDMRIIVADITDAADKPVLVIFDVVADGMTAHGRDENLSTDFVAWAAEAVQPMARAGACVIMNDHTVKAGTNGGYSRGTGAKRAKIDGVCYEVNAPTPLTRDGGGILSLTLHKDRHGRIGRRDEMVARLLFHQNERDLDVQICTPFDQQPGELSIFAEAGAVGVSPQEYADDTHVNERTARKHLTSLVAGGQLTKLKSQRRGKGATSDRYYLPEMAPEPAPTLDDEIDLTAEESREERESRDRPMIGPGRES